MARTEGWQFIQMGKHLERADKTSRFLDIRVHSAQSGNSLDSIQWASILRSASAFGTYRQEVGGEPDSGRGDRSAGVLHPVSHAPSGIACSASISISTPSPAPRPAPMPMPAERLAGRLLATLNFGGSSEVLDRGPAGLHG